MTQKQNTQNTKNYQQRPSIDGVDNAADLYRQFDAELGQLFDGGDDVFAVPEPADDRPSYYSEAREDQDTQEYVKDDQMQIRFQGAKPLALETPTRDAALEALKAQIAQKEGSETKLDQSQVQHEAQTVAQHPQKEQRPQKAQQEQRVQQLKHLAQKSVQQAVMPAPEVPAAPVAVPAQQEVITQQARDLDTGSGLGGRSSLMAELSGTKKDAPDLRRTPAETATPDVVRVGGAGVRIERSFVPKKERPTEAQRAEQRKAQLQKELQPQQRTEPTHRSATHAQSADAPKVHDARQPQKPRPAAFQLGQKVSDVHEAPGVIASQYTPGAHSAAMPARAPQTIDPATPIKEREGIVAFFNRKDAANAPQEERVDQRAHMSIGSDAFVPSAQRVTPFAQIKERMQQQEDAHDRIVEDALDGGTITFTHKQDQVSAVEHPQSSPAQPKTPLAHDAKQALAAAAASTINESAVALHAVTKRPQRTAAPHVEKMHKAAQAQPLQSLPQSDEAQLLTEALQRQAQRRLQMAQQPKKKVVSEDLGETGSSQVDVAQPSVPHTEPAPEKTALPGSRFSAASRQPKLRQPKLAVPRATESSPVPQAQKPQVPTAQKSKTATKPVPHKKRRMSRTVMGIILAAVVIFFLVLAQRGADLYSSVKGAAESGFGSLQAAVADVKEQDFESSENSFTQAARSLAKADASFAQVNSGVVAIAQYVPFLSKVSSGKGAIEVGQRIAHAGAEMSKAGQLLKGVGNPLEGEASILDLYQRFAQHVNTAHEDLIAADTAMQKINTADIPAENRDQFVELKERLPVILAALARFEDSSHVIADLLGANGPRKYLFLFQNNHEMRATGGFIGSYGRLDISNGTVSQFFIDGIFNPDGQLTDKIVPPKPIQKISAAWSLHDSNWFPHFPTSAEEAIVFYERTGGPTVDGVIAITPIVLERLLAVTGPVHLAEYEKDITAENFMERLQQEVEVDYDKEENRPKKILSDLAPIILERVFATSDGAQMRKVIDIMSQMLVERHIQLYARNDEVEGWINAAGWGGTIADVPYDYLSVINTNINGYKTDGVVDETIYHWAEIQDDGSIIDTVRVVRKHNGGYTPYEWWNKVNANYMRVFVPRGSELISVSGQTREFVEPPLDYTALGFDSDARVVEEEQSMYIDDETGTRIYDQNDKTVFANWVYVSPQETVTVEYKYRLPFRVRLDGPDSADTYSVLYQKQAGSIGSTLVSDIVLPDDVRSVWSHPESLGTDQWNTNLVTDHLRGVVLAPAE